MISAVRLTNFVSHGQTEIEFDPGVSVFVGNNGAGKSAVIDGITYALFGKARGTSKGAIRRGQNSATAQVEFAVRGKKYRATRMTNLKGELTARLEEERGGKWEAVIEGERKAYGESVTKRIEKILGMDFDKLRIATIVRQGELNAIIEAKPKEFKQTLNAVIGIDRLDDAAERMGEAIKRFRACLKAKVGHDDREIDLVRKENEGHLQRLNNDEPALAALRAEAAAAEKNIAQAQAAMQKEQDMQQKVSLLGGKEAELARHAKDAIASLRAEIKREEKKISECSASLEAIGTAGDPASEIAALEAQIAESERQAQKAAADGASISTKLAIAAKLRLQDGRCPVCSAPADSLNPMYDEASLLAEQKRAQDSLESARQATAYARDRKRAPAARQEGLQQARAVLRAHGIADAAQLEAAGQAVERKRASLAGIPAAAQAGAITQEIASIDERAGALYKEILSLRQETAGYDSAEFGRLKASCGKMIEDQRGRDRRMGMLEESITVAKDGVAGCQTALAELEPAAEYAALLEKIRGQVFNRDGPVGTKLRSWALGNISRNATEYLELLDTKIRRIGLAERKNDVTIACYAGTESLDIDSLSGGEKVCVALALRLGMARAFGASDLNIVILDEPTAHLDAERRSAMVDVLSRLAEDSGEGEPMQFVIITHDAEIFDSGAVEGVYEFSSEMATGAPTVVRKRDVASRR